jgi:large subunit ribosomal protein L37
MRLTPTLCRQHIGFMFKKHWLVQGKRVPTETGAQQILQAKGINVVDVQEYLHPKRTTFDMDPNEFVGYLPKEEQLDSTHKNWHDRPCHLFRDSNVLLEGVAQAQVLLKTMVINELPTAMEEAVAKQKVPAQVDKAVQESVMAACVYDAEQKVLARRKIPERPAYVLPRDYGITDGRKNRLLTIKLLTHCERLAGHAVTVSRKVMSDAFFVVNVEKEGDLVQFEVTADTMIAAKAPISTTSKLGDVELPTLFPIKHTISIPAENIYRQRQVFRKFSYFSRCFPSLSSPLLFPALLPSNAFSNPHTIFVHFSPQDVKNQFETMVTPSQFESRAMIKAFSTAAAKAQALYGADVKDLPKPIVVQCVQTNGQTFHFGVFQLNTMDLDGVDGTKNYWFTRPNINLYEECGYQVGRPVLEGYNADVMRLMNVFYRSQ